MKKRALMALPKLTATDEMKQIAASDLPRKEKTTYGYSHCWSKGYLGTLQS